MSVPGAENPDKVKNIVRGPGNLQGFRDLYGPLMNELSELRFTDKEEVPTLDGERMMTVSLQAKKREEELTLQQSADAAYKARLLTSLPIHVQQKVLAAVLGSTSVSTPSINTDMAGRVLQHAEFRKALLNGAVRDWKGKSRHADETELRLIIRRPALTQSVKGLVTAGVTKSFHYSLAKFRKWLKSGQSK
jgi:translocator assembly and maintenance protein 41